MILRIAKPFDYKSLAKLHLSCSINQPNGFMFKLGLPFLKTYYKLLINEKNSVIILAEDEGSNLVGFASGTMDAAAHLKNLKKYRFRIGFSMIPSIIKSPKILNKIIDHERFVFSKEGYVQFGVMTGPRAEYWAWDPKDKSNMAIPLLKSLFLIMFDLGAASVRAEVDINNENLLTIYKFLGAKVINHLNLNDGRKRAVIEYSSDLKLKWLQKIDQRIK